MKNAVKITAIVMVIIMLTAMLPTGTFALSDTKEVKSLSILKNDYVYYENDFSSGGWMADSETPTFGYDPYSSFIELDIEITYTNNTTEIFNYGEYMNSDEFYEEMPDIADEYQNLIPWEKDGEDNFYMVEYKGATLKVPVTIIPTPVKSIEILENTYKFIEGDYSVIEGLAADEESFLYSAAHAVFFGLKLKINYNDGTKPTIFSPNLGKADMSFLEETDFEIFAEKYIAFIQSITTIDSHPYTVDYTDQYENPWTLGSNNSFKFSYKGFTIDIPATVTETPVKSIEILENPYKYTKESKNEGYWDINYETEDPQFVYVEDYATSGLKVKINYNDNTSDIFDMRENKLMMLLNNHLFYTYSDQEYTPWETGSKNSYVLHYLGVETKVTATVVDPNGIDASKKFKDVGKSKWYTDYVNYAVNYGLFNGTSDNTFAPDQSMNRAMFVQVLANLAGAKTNENADTGFKDVPKGKWYTGAVDWAAENGIVNGMGEGKFNPTASITREQMCTMIVRFADYMSMKLFAVNDKEKFTDDKKIAEYAKTAVYECQTAGLVNGMGDGTFAPKATATRAQVAKILSVFHNGYFSAA